MRKKSKKIVKKKNLLTLKFPSYLTSHTKPQNLRKYVASNDRLSDMDKKPFYAWGKPRPIPRGKQTWPQAKIRQPLLNPRGDADKDGVINLLDCRPFNKRKQGFFHKDQGVSDDLQVDFEDIEKLKTIKDVQRLTEDTLRRDR